jgi:hypothetical protein
MDARRYNTNMWAIWLRQAPEAQLPASVALALLVIGALSALALFVSLRLARRMRAIGDAGDQRPTMDDGRKQDEG